MFYTDTKPLILMFVSIELYDDDDDDDENMFHPAMMPTMKFS